MHHFSVNMRKQYANPNWRTFYKIISKHASKIMKFKELLENWRDWDATASGNNIWSWVGFDLSQKKAISRGKLSTFK